MPHWEPAHICSYEKLVLPQEQEPSNKRTCVQLVLFSGTALDRKQDICLHEGYWGPDNCRNCRASMGGPGVPTLLATCYPTCDPTCKPGNINDQHHLCIFLTSVANNSKRVQTTLHRADLSKTPHQSGPHRLHASQAVGLELPRTVATLDQAATPTRMPAGRPTPPALLSYHQADCQALSPRAVAAVAGLVHGSSVAAENAAQEQEGSGPARVPAACSRCAAARPARACLLYTSDAADE